VASRLGRILDEHGPEAVAVYLGNPSAFNALGSMATGMFAASLGVPHVFNAGTQDCANKFAVSEILYGSAEIHPVADLARSELLLLVGTNPRVSKMSFLSTPDPVAALRARRDRGATTVFVNPLRIPADSRSPRRPDAAVPVAAPPFTLRTHRRPASGGTGVAQTPNV
jgi:anaerobic selenocysteine-containing dehydrogenase